MLSYHFDRDIGNEQFSHKLGDYEFSEGKWSVLGISVDLDLNGVRYEMFRDGDKISFIIFANNYRRKIASSVYTVIRHMMALVIATFLSNNHNMTIPIPIQKITHVQIS